MASKRRNMFQKNKTQVTTENGVAQSPEPRNIFQKHSKQERYKRDDENRRIEECADSEWLYSRFETRLTLSAGGNSSAAAAFFARYPGSLHPVLAWTLFVGTPSADSAYGDNSYRPTRDVSAEDASKMGSEMLEPSFATTRSTPEDPALLAESCFS
ncbi:hypothetical protein AAG570_003833 [Ranatra chinensis]|uniref:Uncharacterized protein n=1 Tax=Ranatra chinensis TaxID=642074 RepID=A0ABD0YK58_9HEMI